MLTSDYEDNFVLRSLVNNLSYPEAGIIFLESLIEKHYLEVEEDDWSEEGEDDETEITMTYDSLIELWVWLLNQYNRFKKSVQIYSNQIIGRNNRLGFRTTVSP